MYKLLWLPDLVRMGEWLSPQGSQLVLANLLEIHQVSLTVIADYTFE